MHVTRPVDLLDRLVTGAPTQGGVLRRRRPDAVVKVVQTVDGRSENA